MLHQAYVVSHTPSYTPTEMYLGSAEGTRMHDRYPLPALAGGSVGHG